MTTNDEVVLLRPGNSRYVGAYSVIFGLCAWAAYTKEGTSGAFWFFMALTAYPIAKSVLCFLERLRLRREPEGECVLETRYLGFTQWRVHKRLRDASGAVVTVVPGAKNLWPTLRITTDSESIEWDSQAGHAERDQSQLMAFLAAN